MLICLSCLLLIACICVLQSGERASFNTYVDFVLSCSGLMLLIRKSNVLALFIILYHFLLFLFSICYFFLPFYCRIMIDEGSMTLLLLKLTKPLNTLQQLLICTQSRSDLTSSINIFKVYFYVCLAVVLGVEGVLHDSEIELIPLAYYVF